MKQVFLSMLVSLSILMNANGNNNTLLSTNTSNAEISIAVDEEQEDYIDSELVQGKFRRGFSSITELGATHIAGKTFFSISETWGIRINPYVFVGQGMHLNVSNNQCTDLSATIDVRANLLKRNVSPQLLLGMGINKSSRSIKTNDDVLLSANKFVLNLGAGVEFRISPRAGITLNGGYKLLANQTEKNHGGFVKVGYVF
jgi:opacity protein-like surface antigen